jgi:hypothetical protein
MHLHARRGYWQPENLTSAFLDCSSAFSDAALGARARARCCPDVAQCDRVPRSAAWKAADQCEPGYSGEFRCWSRRLFKCCLETQPPSLTTTTTKPFTPFTHAGPLCIVCADDHLLFDSECIPCDGGSPLWLGVLGILVIGFIIFLAVAILLKRIENVKSAEHEDGNTKLARVGGLVSILVSWLQILSAFTVTFKMRWPSNFAAYSKGSGAAVNLEVFSFLALGNCSFAIPFINKFLLQIFTPPVFVGAVFLAWFVLRACDRKKRAPDRQGAVQHARTAHAWQFAILIVQLLYPKLATSTFQMFRCVDLGDRLGLLLLEADFSKICFEGVHMAYVPFAVLSAIIYLVGVPAGVFFGLHRNRGRLDQLDMQSKYGDLYRKYENSYYFWECILMLQKCMLTGAMCAIAPGSPLQLLVAVFVCMAYLLLVLHANPFKGSLEDRLAFLTSLCLTISLILGFALIMDDRDAPLFDMHVVGVLLILINILPFPYWAFAMSCIVRFGPNYGILMSAKAGSWSEDGGTKLDGLGGDGEERGCHSQLPRTKMKRHLSVVEMRRAVEHEQVVILQATSNKHREAHIARIKEREARADARVKVRLAERAAAKARAGRRPEAMKKRKKKTAVMPAVVDEPVSEEQLAQEIRTWKATDKKKKKKKKKRNEPAAAVGEKKK